MLLIQLSAFLGYRSFRQSICGAKDESGASCAGSDISTYNHIIMTGVGDNLRLDGSAILSQSREASGHTILKALYRRYRYPQWTVFRNIHIHRAASLTFTAAWIGLFTSAPRPPKSRIPRDLVEACLGCLISHLIPPTVSERFNIFLPLTSSPLFSSFPLPNPDYSSSTLFYPLVSVHKSG